MGRERIVFVAGMSRVVLAGLAVLVLPLLYPGLGSWRPLFLGYVGFALFEQLLIHRRVGGTTRSFLAGLVDLAVLTFIVQRVGSVSTPLVSLYFFSGIMNALAVSLRVGMWQAAIGSAAFAAVLWAEQTGALGYGPDAPARLGRLPTRAEAMAAMVLVATMLALSSLVVGWLVRALAAREHDLAAANERLLELSRRDPLTQMFNRRYLLERLEVELARVRRGHPLAVVMLDLDGFKHVNDEQGHLRGDLLLKELGVALAGTTRASDVASRYGGDEFVVLLPDTDAEQAARAAERLATSVRAVGERFDAARPVTASIGLALAREEDAVASLLRRADESAYRAKQAGGDRVVGAA
jgi:diguanylate cyclase (GGDEF)-like protein